MYSFQTLTKPGFAIVAVMFVIACWILFRLIQKTKLKASSDQPHSLKKSGILSIVIGDFLIILSVVEFILLEKDLARTLSIFRPIAIMGSEPMVLLVIALLVAGIVFEINGIYSLIKCRPNKDE